MKVASKVQEINQLLILRGSKSIGKKEFNNRLNLIISAQYRADENGIEVAEEIELMRQYMAQKVISKKIFSVQEKSLNSFTENTPVQDIIPNTAVTQPPVENGRRGKADSSTKPVKTVMKKVFIIIIAIIMGITAIGIVSIATMPKEYKDGYASGEKTGYDKGYKEGQQSKAKTSYDEGYAAGKEEGYENGFNAGYTSASAMNVPAPTTETTPTAVEATSTAVKVESTKFMNLGSGDEYKAGDYRIVVKSSGEAITVESATDITQEEFTFSGLKKTGIKKFVCDDGGARWVSERREHVRQYTFTPDYNYKKASTDPIKIEVKFTPKSKKNVEAKWTLSITLDIEKKKEAAAKAKKKAAAKAKKKAAKEKERQQQQNEQTVYVTPTGKRYHRYAHGRGSFTSATIDNARARGLTPCQVCW